MQIFQDFIKCCTMKIVFRKGVVTVQKPFKIMLLFGTRAEAIKLAPIIEQMKRDPSTWKPSIVIACPTTTPTPSTNNGVLEFNGRF